MAKKITAPHSYDPGKGRPKEYLAYLNEREMAYLRSINGNNMERGPRGLPSFPPEDAVGSSSKAGSKGPGGPSGPNSSPSRSNGGGGNLGGGGKGPGGPSGPNSSPSRSGSPSAGGGGKGPGGPSGPNSAPSGTRGVGGPSSPMGGQGPSFSNDTKAQQEAQVRDAIKAVKNTPAFRNDASSGGIRTLNVGPMGAPVNVGPRVAPTQNRTSVVGGWGVQGYNSAMPKASSFSSPTTAPAGYRPKNADQIQRSLYGSNKQIYDRVPIGKQFGVLGEGYDERIAPEPSQSTSISSQFPSYKYSSPLTPGTSPEDMARRAAVMNQIEQEMRDMGLINRPAVVRTGSPIDAGGIPTGSGSPSKTRGFSITSPAEAGTLPQKENPLAGTGYGTFNVPSVDRIMAAPENLPPEELRGAAGTYTSTYDVKDPVSAINREKYINAVTPSGAGNPFQKVSGVGDVYDPNAQFSEQPKIPSNVQGSYPGGVRSIDVGEPTDDGFSGIQSSGEIVREGEFGYPTNADGSPITAEDIANMPEDIQKEYFDKVRYSRNYDTPYPLTKAEKEKGFVAGVVTSPLRRGPVGTLLRGLKYVPGELGEAAENLLNPRKAVNEYDRLDPLKKQQMRERAGKGRGFGGGSTSTTSPGGGKPDIGSGGKNEPERVKQTEKEATKPKPKPKGDGRRPAIYYKWDLGVDVPSPTDSDYTLYTKYLQEKAAAKAGFA